MNCQNFFLPSYSAYDFRSRLNLKSEIIKRKIIAQLKRISWELQTSVQNDCNDFSDVKIFVCIELNFVIINDKKGGNIIDWHQSSQPSEGFIFWLLSHRVFGKRNFKSETRILCWFCITPVILTKKQLSRVHILIKIMNIIVANENANVVERSCCLFFVYHATNGYRYIIVKSKIIRNLITVVVPSFDCRLCLFIAAP